MDGTEQSLSLANYELREVTIQVNVPTGYQQMLCVPFSTNNNCTVALKAVNVANSVVVVHNIANSYQATVVNVKSIYQNT